MAIGGNDGADGLTPGTAWATIAHAQATVIPGDTIYVGTGTFDIGTTKWNPPQATTWLGAGMNATTILSQVASPASALLPQTDSYFADFFLLCNLTTNVAQRPIGRSAAEAIFTNVTVERVKMFGNVDVLQFISAGACEITMIDCVFRGGFDLVALSTNAVPLITLINPDMIADAALLPPGYTSAGVTCRCIAAGGPNSYAITITGGSLIARGATTTNDAIVIASGTGTVTADSAFLSGTTYDADAGATGTILLDRCVLAHNTTHGHVVQT